MHEYRQHPSGFFARHGRSVNAFSRLVLRGLPHERLRPLDVDLSVPIPRARDPAVLKDILISGTVGVVVGTSLFAFADLALVGSPANASIAVKLIAPLAMLGWGASLGGLVGAAIGAGSKGRWFRE